MRQLVLGLVLLAACGGDDGGGADASNVDPSLRFEPWKVGAVWSYKLTDPDGVLPPAMDKRTTVVEERAVPGVHAGKLAFFVHVEQLKGSKDVYETHEGDLDIRYQSDFFDDAGAPTGTDVDQPYRLKLDESAAHIATGAQWSETFTETSTTPGVSQPSSKSKTEQWRVVNAAESITVIAGTYTALHIQRTSSGGSIQDYWYVRGVGKVKETGGGQDEELVSFTPGQ